MVASKRRSVLAGITRKGIYGHSWKQFFRDLKNEIKEDDISNGAASLAYYLIFAIFPAMIFLLGILPYLPIADLQGAVMELLNEMLPGDAAKMFSTIVGEVTSHRQGGLLSFGALVTLWSASSGMYSIMQHLNITYDVTEGRPFLKARGTSVLLTLVFGILVVGAFALIVLGGQLQAWLGSSFGLGPPLLVAFAVARWLVIAAGLALAFAVTYYFAPDVKQKFVFVTPGSILGVSGLIITSLVFKLYVDNFGKYSATYGTIGAVIVMMLWLNLIGFVLLLGSEINALIEHYSPHGKEKGEKVENQNERAGGDRALRMDGVVENDSIGLLRGPKLHVSQGTAGGEPGLGAALKEVTTSFQNLLQDEVTLVKAEIKATVKNVGKSSTEMAIFGALAGLGLFPLMAFLVIGLGGLIGDRYGLSALIVSVVCMGVGSFFAFRAFRRIKKSNLTLPITRQTLELEKESVVEGVGDLKDAVTLEKSA